MQGAMPLALNLVIYSILCKYMLYFCGQTTLCSLQSKEVEEPLTSTRFKLFERLKLQFSVTYLKLSR